MAPLFLSPHSSILFQGVLSYRSCYESCPPIGQRVYRPPVRHQGAESDPEKLQLSDRLFAAVLAEARMCCAGQPVILVGDFNADPTVIPSGKGYYGRSLD